MLYVGRLGLEPGEIRDALATALVLVNLLAAAAIGTFAEGFAAPGAGLLAGLAGATIVGQALGKLVFEGMPSRWFRRAGLGLVLVAGVASLAAGTLG